MKPTFNENQFLTAVAHLMHVCVRIPSSRCAKTLIRSALVQTGYNPEQLFRYLQDVCKERLPRYARASFKDVQSWKSIYLTHKRLTNPDYLELGKLLAEREPRLVTVEDYQTCFHFVCTECGLNPQLRLFELVIDSLGWEPIVETLVQMARERGLDAVEEVKTGTTSKKKGKSSRKGRTKKETSRTKTETIPTKSEKLPTKTETVIIVQTPSGKELGTCRTRKEVEQKFGIKKSSISKALGTKSYGYSSVWAHDGKRRLRVRLVYGLAA